MAGRETLPARLHGTGGRFTPAAVCRASSPAILDLPGRRIQSPDCYGKGTSTRRRAVVLGGPIAEPSRPFASEVARWPDAAGALPGSASIH